MGEHIEYIPMNKMKSGHLYEIDARCAGAGIWIAEDKGFMISRHKFGDNSTFTEYHWDTGDGTAKPLKDLGRAPFDYIPLLQLAKGIQADIEPKVLEYLNQQGGV